ncbi:hypothetical protein ACVWZR_007113 [Bradyrhizobium sp. i1.3.1]
MSATCCIAALACCAEVTRSCSTLERSDWMPLVVTLSCFANACAAPRATVCADDEPALVDSACNAVVNLFSAVSSVPLLPGVP